MREGIVDSRCHVADRMLSRKLFGVRRYVDGPREFPGSGWVCALLTEAERCETLSASLFVPSTFFRSGGGGGVVGLFASFFFSLLATGPGVAASSQEQSMSVLLLAFEPGVARNTQHPHSPLLALCSPLPYVRVHTRPGGAAHPAPGHAKPGRTLKRQQRLGEHRAGWPGQSCFALSDAEFTTKNLLRQPCRY